MFKSLDLVPQVVHLPGAVGPYIRDIWGAVHQPPFLEDGHQQGYSSEIAHHFALPSRLRVKQLQRLGEIGLLVMDTDIVSHGLASGVFEQAIDLFEVRDGDLGGVLADLDFGDDGAVLPKIKISENPAKEMCIRDRFMTYGR